jgi:spermidine synthase
MNYLEDTIDEFGVLHMWPNATIEYSTVTKMGTTVEIVNKPKWGLTCYMDNSVQSCLKDEKIYHEALVHPVMMSAKSRKRVCVIGGGEGATIREVFKFDDVEEVDMYEWDREVVNLFRDKYTEWSNGAFEDNRLVIIYDDIFKTIKEVPHNKYDVVIIDLFEPTDDNYNKWQELLGNLVNWIHEDTTIVMYAGMRNILKEKGQQSYEKLIDIINNQGDEWHGIKLNNYDKHILPYKIYIPSFSGESVFILLKDRKNGIRPTDYNIVSHLKNNIGSLMSYCTFNW